MEENIRKFKLIKEYPNSPKLGSIMEYYSNWNMYGINQICYYNKDVVENNSEFWQEIIEKDKDYEILSFIGSGGLIKDRIYRLMSNKQYCFEHTNTHSLEWMLSAIGVPDEINPVVIYSVKRLSDNEIFSIGDNVTLFGWKHTDCFIEGFKINDKIDSLGITIKQEDTTSTYYNGLDTLRKVEKVPLFKSEDGVDMYIGDRYFRIISNWEIQEENVIQLGEHIYKNDTIKRFSTKEKALEYIIENKPCLSYNDIKDIAFGLFMNVSSGKTFFNEEAVKELVKSKLK